MATGCFFGCCMGALAVTGCQSMPEQPAHLPAVSTTAPPLASKFERFPTYTPDTAAILFNRNLVNILSEVARDSLVEHKKASAIPPVISAFLHQTDSLYHEPFALADYGQRYNTTDVSEEGLPRRQLLYLGVGKRTVLLAYNLGGFGLSERVLLFEIRQNRITDFWTGYVQNTASDKHSIIKRLIDNKDKKWGVNTNILHL